MNDGKQSTPPAELEHQICGATVPKNEREWWAHHEIARLQESNRLRAELLAAAKAEIAALRAALAEPDEPVAYLDEGLGVFYWPTEYEKLPHRDFVALFTHPPRREPLMMERLKEIIERGDVAQPMADGTGWYVLPYSLAHAVERAHGIGTDE